MVVKEAEREQVQKLRELMRGCRLCPRKCGVDRLAGELGFCRTGPAPVVSSWGPHFGEERPLIGLHGSGTIFFTFCNLGCLYCQNWTISHEGEGHGITVERLADIMLDLQEQGCHNVNLVTPTHQSAVIAEAIMAARERGLAVPIVYNCGGYESIETLRLLEGMVQIYMPDIKYMSAEYAKKYSYAEDYPEVVMAAIREMHRQVGDLAVDRNGTAIRGLLVRHLVLPDNIAETEKAVRFIAQEISKNTYINIMDQYRPCYRAREFEELSRSITGAEFRRAVQTALDAGLKRIDGVKEQ